MRTSAPLASRRAAHSASPTLHAEYNGVAPLPSRAFTSAPASSSSLRHRPNPRMHAQWSGVEPPASTAL
eukprot:scaffold23254_cov103-Isochrysis_galbana.AAC.1